MIIIMMIMLLMMFTIGSYVIITVEANVVIGILMIVGNTPRTITVTMLRGV
jgi:hypothetical protein